MNRTVIQPFGSYFLHSKMPGDSAIILCYHKVGPESEEGRSLNIDPARLASHISHFQRRGKQFVLGKDYGSSWQPNSVCLTFDDAYVSALTHGREVMLRANVRGTFYVVSSLVGDASRWDGPKARPLADEPLLRAALAEGFELGNHTRSHPRLAELASGQQKELEDCRAYLAGLGVIDASFCYPYGNLDRASVAAVRKCGYQVGMALGGRRAKPDDDRLQLPRIVVAYSDTLPLLLYRVFLRPRLKRS